VLADYLARVQSLVEQRQASPVEVLVAVTRGIARQLGVEPADPPGGLLDGSAAESHVDLVVPAPLASPDLLGSVHQVLGDRRGRRRRGVFYTPAAVADQLVAVAVSELSGSSSHPPRICDPSCGGGAFLLAAARSLAAQGWTRRQVVDQLIWGIDREPLAVAVARTSLSLWAAEGGETADGARVVIGDTLTQGRDAWLAPPDGFDVVVGNPPFQGQLMADTARTAAETAALRRRLGRPAAGYADTAALFLVAGVQLARVGGVVALILPESFLSARDAGPSREAVLGSATLRGIWMADEPLFDAAVRVCAPVLRRESSDRPATVRRWVGAGFAELGPPPTGTSMPAGGATWAPLVADRRGAPTVDLDSSHDLSSLATATAGFRDQYYGLVDHVIDAAGAGTERAAERAPEQRLLPLITSGLIDPAHSLWGERDARFAKRSWRAPVVDLEAVRHDDPELFRWVRPLLVPKVLVASQTRVIEAIVDVEGNMWPSVPVVAVSARPGQLWRVAAVLLSPPVTAWAMRHYGGAALSGDAVKLAARQILSVPLPDDPDAWATAATHLRTATDAAVVGDADGWLESLGQCGEAMCDAYGVPRNVATWWFDRLPRFRTPSAVPALG
jgi:hypothetical protein